MSEWSKLWEDDEVWLWGAPESWILQVKAEGDKLKVARDSIAERSIRQSRMLRENTATFESIKKWADRNRYAFIKDVEGELNEIMMPFQSLKEMGIEE